MVGKIYCILASISGVWDGGSSATPGNLQFLLSFKLRNIASITKSGINVLHRKYWLPYPAHILCLQDSPTNQTEYENKGTSKSPNFPTAQVEKFGSTV